MTVVRPSARAHEARRRRGRRRLGERTPDGVRLLLADDQEHDVRAGLERGDRQRHPLDERLEAGLRRDRQALALVQGGRVGKERRGVAVGAEAEQDEVERLAAELGVIRGGGLVRRQVGRDGVHGRVDDDPVEQRVAHEPLVGERIVRGNAAVVAEPEIDATPIPVEGGRELVRLAGSGAAGQHDRAARLDGLGQERGHGGGRGAGIGDDDELHVARAAMVPTHHAVTHRAPTHGTRRPVRPSPRPRDPPRGRGRRPRS